MNEQLSPPPHRPEPPPIPQVPIAPTQPSVPRQLEPEPTLAVDNVAPAPQTTSSSATPVSFNSKEEADEALERLRMRYIAGELTREDYYNEKTVIERAAASI